MIQKSKKMPGEIGGRKKNGMDWSKSVWVERELAGKKKRETEKLNGNEGWI